MGLEVDIKGPLVIGSERSHCDKCYAVYASGSNNYDHQKTYVLDSRFSSVRSCIKSKTHAC
jgi:hypothetical protein